MSYPVASRLRSGLASVFFGFVIALCILIAPGILRAQVSTTGKIAGTVTDASGAAVPTATVSVKSTALLVPRSSQAAGDGSYLFDLLPPGTYELTVTSAGFSTYSQTGIVLTAGFTATINAKLQVGEVTQVVKVEGEPVVDLQNNQTSTTFDQSLLQDIPSGRDPWSTVAQMPGVTSSTFDVAGNNSYQQSAMQVHGSTQAEQIYSYNGLDLNWPGANGGYTQFYTNHDSFDEFQVVADNAPASVPIGGVYMNMVTKSGSNEWHGLAAAYYLTAATQAGVKQPVFQGTPVDTGSPFDMTRDTSASLGGPLWKNKWWLFGSYRRYDLNQRILAVKDQSGAAVKDINHQTNTDLRSDLQVNSKNKFSFIWLYNEQNRFFRRDTAYQFVTADASWKQIEPAYILQGLWTSQVTNNFLLDFRVGWNKIFFPLSYQSNSTGLNKQDIGFSTETGAAPNEFQNPAWVLKWSAGGSWYKANWGGNHNFQFGFEWGKSYNSYINKVSQGINAQYNGGAQAFSTPFQVVAYNTPTTQKNYFRDTSFYLQDTWTLKRHITLNLGIRYDRFTTYFPAQTTDANLTFPQLFSAGFTFPASGDLVDWNTVSPRIGVAFDPTGKGNSVLRFGYGIYYIMQGTGLAELSNPNGLVTLTFPWTDTNGDKIPQVNEWLPAGAKPINSSGGAQINHNMGRPYSEEISAGYEKQLWRDLRVGATYYFRTKKNLYGIENTDVQKSDYTPITMLNDPVTGLPTVPIINGLTGKPMTLFNFNPTPSRPLTFNNLVTNIPALDDNSYHAVEFTAVKRLSNKWQVLGGLTIQRQKGVFGRGFSDQATGDNFTDPNNDINRKNNYLNLDSTYVFKVDSTYELPWKFGTSVNFQHYTGFPIQPTETFGGYPNSGLNQFSETVILQPAGIQRLPSVNQLNLRFSREFVLNDRWHLTPTIDFFNVTNSQTTISEVAQWSPPTGGSYQLPSLAINPFVTRFGLRFTF
ncbi:MAG TPA: carboxypeptidase regulatory-like domain-containing protein [Candidatus Acidoferrum sp.]|nr:carboxypeptidase regulatory-like domain-containing protein [Candidatus Acidoferrum sp.]